MTSQFLKLFAEGYARANRDDLRGANELYEQALRALGGADHPQLTALLTNLAQNALMLGEPDKGWEYFDRALTRALDTTRPQLVMANTWHQFAWILYERGEVAHAAQALDLVNRALLTDNRLETHDTRMRILLKLGREAEARAVAVAALHRDFDHQDFQDIKEYWGLHSPEVVAAAHGTPVKPAARATPAAKPRKRPPRPRVSAPAPRMPVTPRPKSIDELREFKGQRPAGQPAAPPLPGEPQLDLAPVGRAKTPRARAQELLREHLRSSPFLRPLRSPLRRSQLLAVAGELGSAPYAQVDAALGLALLKEPLAIPVLRRVLIEPHFAATSSLHEQGLAALGLALLGDHTQLPRIRLCPRQNQNAITVALAITILEARGSGS